MVGQPRFGPVRPRLILAICCSSLFIVGMDNTIVNVTLPSISRHFGASVSQLQWVVDAYLIVLASLLIFSGSLADRVGRVRIFSLGLVLFGLASLACGLSSSAPMLIACRALQGVGGSMLNPVALSVIRETFGDPVSRARAIGVWGAVIGISMGVGPVLGGFLVEFISWRAVFLVNIPVAAAALVLTWAYIPESRAATPRRADPLGQVLVLVGLGCLTHAIIEAPRSGWGSPFIIGSLVLAAVCLVALVPWSLHRDQPLIEVRAFRSPEFSAATAIAVLAFFALGGYMFLLTLYLQDTRGLDAVHAGMMLLPNALMMLVVAPLSGRATGAYGPRIPMAVGGVALTLGTALLVTVGTDTGYLRILVSSALVGIGSGAVNAPITNTAVSGLPADQAGVAAAIASASRQVGSVLGVAVAGMLAATAAHAIGTDPVAWLSLVVSSILIVVIAGLLGPLSRRRTVPGPASAVIAETRDDRGA